MTKKLISVWLSLTIVLFSSISIYAEENVQGDFFIKKIVVNGEKIDNNQLQFPFFIYKDTTYFPLTSEMGEIFGFKAEMDFESRTLKLLKTEPSMTNISERWKKNERGDVVSQVFSDAKVVAYEIQTESIANDIDNTKASENEVGILSGEAKIESESIFATGLSTKELDLEGLPVLTIGNVVYLPLRALAGESGLSWDVYYDSYTGVYVSTKQGVAAKSFCNEAESKYNKGLVSYIKKYNGNYSTSKAQELVFIFKYAAEIYKIDEKILMAVAHKESTFNAKAVGSSGSLGMMQVMPSTGARYGLSSQDLLDAETSIYFGAMYLSERITAYGGDLTKGFSAYNQGSVSVNRGTYSTRYAGRIIGTINGINSYLTSNGYGLGY